MNVLVAVKCSECQIRHVVECASESAPIVIPACGHGEEKMNERTVIGQVIAS